MLDTRKLDEVLQFINRYNDENGFPPTVREICKELNIKSTATVYDYINRLRAKGHLSKAENKKRAVAVRSSGSVTVPLVGTVTAGQPILATENYEGYYALPASEFKGDLFMLTVKGDSMIEAGIFEGDKIVVRKQESAENGDIVVALFNDGIEEGATVKRYFQKEGKIILHPENEKLSDFVLDHENDVKILGKVIGLMRSM
ncbi:MAG: transcriptional repressor LexA [Clostridia bacterium]|jgi:repressor LexA|nr:transcriptional repressor LexA [Clostridia bacterium]